LYLSYSFEWIHPDVEEGSAEAEALQADHKNTARMAVEMTIKTIRKLVSEGKL
jgi:hypothetical protein